MNLKSLIFTSLLLVCTLSQASSLLCNMPSNPNASIMKIQYEDMSPIKIFLKNNNENEFREIDANIEVVFPNNGNGNESFSVKPKIISKDIDWSEESYCYKLVGDLWYFTFKHEEAKYSLQLTPYVVLEDNRCIPPRYRPQTKKLNCSFL